MSLRLEYPDKYRLWSDLIQGNTDRVFIATEELLRIGSRAPVELSLHGLPVSLVIHGLVIGIRRRSERFAAGVYFRFPDEEIDKCRRFLGLSQSPDRYEHGRKAKRVPCELKVALRHPASPEPALAKNLSEIGILLASPVELYSGQYLELDLTLDDGACFTMRCEVTRAGTAQRLAGVRFLDPPPEVIAAIAACVDRLAEVRPPPHMRTVVIADDDPTILEFLSKALTRYGYEVHKARRGEEALALVRELRPKLVILDILMPGIDGVDICKMMRSDEEIADVPVIFVSALDPDRLHQVADEAGASDYLPKPVALAELINMVGTYLKRSE
ncbi:MAG: response regulator [Myxococcales bacterium]|nr:response regulator [Myxococcales bacterium]